MSFCIHLKQKMNRTLYCKKANKQITFKDCNNCKYQEFKAMKKYQYRPKKGKCSRYYNNLSIMPVSTLYFNKSMLGCEKHHIFGSVANRPKSEEYGLFIWLTPRQHRYLHENPKAMLDIKKEAQKSFIKCYDKTVEEFRAIFGKNYLD